MVKIIGPIENITFERKSADEVLLYLYPTGRNEPMAVELDDGLAEKLEWAAARVGKYV